MIYMNFSDLLSNYKITKHLLSNKADTWHAVTALIEGICYMSNMITKAYSYVLNL